MQTATLRFQPDYIPLDQVAGSLYLEHKDEEWTPAMHAAISHHALAPLECANIEEPSKNHGQLLSLSTAPMQGAFPALTLCVA